jgi:enoyl-CoA hydratase
MTNKRLLIEHPGERVAHVVMNRSEKLNAMDRRFFDELLEVMGGLAEDSAVGAVVLRGAGRAFSAGGDITTFPTVAESFESSTEHLDAVFGAFHAVESCPVPVIAAVHGFAHGGGLEILVACDMAIAASDATFAFREASLGLMPGFGVSRAPDKIGLQWTLRLATSGEEIDATKALSIGLVMDVVEPADLVQTAHKLAAEIAANSRDAVAAIKSHALRHASEGLSAAVDLTARTFQTDRSRSEIQGFLDRSR